MPRGKPCRFFCQRCIWSSLVLLLRPMHQPQLPPIMQRSASDSAWESSICCVTLLSSTSAQCKCVKCQFLLYLCSSNVHIGAGVEPLKRIMKFLFCFLFHGRRQLNPYLSRFATVYVSCQPFSCAETPAKSKSSFYPTKYIMWSHKNGWKLERVPSWAKIYLQHIWTATCAVVAWMWCDSKLS